jgi:hypothetical protein
VIVRNTTNARILAKDTAATVMRDCNSRAGEGTFCWTGNPVLLIIRHPAFPA